MCGVVRKACGCSVLHRSRTGGATLPEVGVFWGGPVPSMQSTEPVPGKPWDAQWREVGGEGVRAGSLSGLGMLFGVGGSAPGR